MIITITCYVNSISIKKESHRKLIISNEYSLNNFRVCNLIVKSIIKH